MIRSSVRKRFHTVWWNAPTYQLTPPVILYANHHGWMDGYLMYVLVKRLGLVSLDWIQEFDAFPLFRFVGGLRFAAGDVAGRATTIRHTIRELNKGRSLVIFPEGELHRPPGLLPFGRAVQTVARKVQSVTMLPVAIRYEFAMHERPEACLVLGNPHAWKSLAHCENALSELLQRTKMEGEVLFQGTRDINERMDMRHGVRR